LIGKAGHYHMSGTAKDIF